MDAKKRTKIIATLGPASNNKEMLERLFVAGVNLVRLNLSHGTLAEHQKTAIKVREVAEAIGEEIGIIVDLQGPKLRITQVNGGKVQLTEGDSFTINVELGDNLGEEHEVGVTYPDLIQNVAIDDILVLDDGLIKLKVKNIEASKIDTVCLEGTCSFEDKKTTETGQARISIGAGHARHPHGDTKLQGFDVTKAALAAKGSSSHMDTEPRPRTRGAFDEVQQGTCGSQTLCVVRQGTCVQESPFQARIGDILQRLLRPSRLVRLRAHRTVDRAESEDTNGQSVI